MVVMKLKPPFPGRRVALPPTALPIPIKVYEPVAGEEVVGVVRQRRGEVFRVDIGARGLAELPETAFNGATKRNKPALEIGDTVFAVVEAVLDDYVKLSCVDDSGKGWASKEVLYGVLEHGWVVDQFPVSCFSKKLDEQDHEPEPAAKRRKKAVAASAADNGAARAAEEEKPRVNLLPQIFRKLAKSFVFETAVGKNDRVYVRGAARSTTFLLGQVIERIGKGGGKDKIHRSLTDAQVEVVLRKLQAEHGLLPGKEGSIK
eukprot:g3380.t1